MNTDENEEGADLLDTIKAAIAAGDAFQLDSIRSDPEGLSQNEFMVLHTGLIKIYHETKETNALLAMVDDILDRAEVAIITNGTKVAPMVGNGMLDFDAAKADILEKAMMSLISLHREAGKTPGGRDAAAFELHRMKQRLDKFWEYPMKRKWRAISISTRGTWERSFAKVRSAMDTAINEIGVSQIIKEKAPMPNPEAARAAKPRAARLKTS